MTQSELLYVTDLEETIRELLDALEFDPGDDEVSLICHDAEKLLDQGLQTYREDED